MDRFKHENLLPLGLTPGPKAPKDLDSFITPFCEELHLLQTGVKAYDSLTKSEFTLKGHLVLVTGDTPAISKLLHLSGHNAIYLCRACNLQGTLYHYTKSKVQNKETITTNHSMNYYPPHGAERRTFKSYK
jgi:Transposase family tnp2